MVIQEGSQHDQQASFPGENFKSINVITKYNLPTDLFMLKQSTLA